MSFWIRSGLPAISISDWLAPAPARGAAPQPTMDEARQSMLQALGDAGAARHSRLALKIRMASTGFELWDLRPELMTAVSQLHGESVGAKRLAAVTAMFAGLVPQARALTSAGPRLAMQRRT